MTPVAEATGVEVLHGVSKVEFIGNAASRSGFVPGLVGHGKRDHRGRALMMSSSHPADAANASISNSGSAASYALRSELAQFCFPAAHRDAQRKLAWVDSLCLWFLIIGVVGLKPPVPVVTTVAPLEEPLTAVIEPPPASQPQELAPAEATEEISDQSPDTPQVVAVALPSPSFNFSVPTRGNLIVPAAMASAPPPRPMQAPQQATAPKLSVLLPQGKGGDRPFPPYPQEMIQKDMSGTVVLLARVDTNGVPASITLQTSCGHPQLDKHTLDWVKRQWTFPRGASEQEYKIPIEYNLIGASRK